MFVFICFMMQMFICFGIAFFGILFGNWLLNQMDKHSNDSK